MQGSRSSCGGQWGTEGALKGAELGHEDSGEGAEDLNVLTLLGRKYPCHKKGGRDRKRIGRK